MTNEMPKPPPIVIDAKHAAKLRQLGSAALDRMPDVAETLLAELDRARVLNPDRFPADAVNMLSWVDYKDRTTGQQRTVQLVYPEDADIAQGRISILTPIGTALLGLVPGQIMGWSTRDGAARALEVTAVFTRDPLGDPSAGAH